VESLSSPRRWLRKALAPCALSVVVSASAWQASAQTGAAPPASTVPTDAQTVLSAVINDAARRSGVPAAQLRASALQSVTWPDGALGCPQPDRAYTQALVPGWRIVVALPDAPPLTYHASRRGAWVWCAKPGAPVAPNTVD